MVIPFAAVGPSTEHIAQQLYRLSYTLFQNGRHYGVILFSFKLPLAIAASFLNLKFKRIFPLERGNKG